MPRAFLIASLIGLALVLNARRAVRLQLVLVPAFFASWVVAELAPQLLVLHVVGTVVFVVRGALDDWPGWVGLGCSAMSAYLLWQMVRESHRAHDVLDEALTEAIGPAAAHTPVVWKEIVFPFKLWSRKIERVRNVAYAAPGTRRHRLDVWHPTDEASGRPCLLYVPGGAWTVGISNKDHQGKPLLIEMASRGWVCFAMNYPVSPRARFPEHIIAVKRAIAWIRDNARTYGGDATFLMVSGNSAGGHLSALAALSANDAAYQPGFEDADTTIQAAAPIYGIYDISGATLDELSGYERRFKRGFLRFFERTIAHAKRSEHADLFASGSPWHRVGDHAPPFFIIHGAMDTLARPIEARAFAKRLRDVSTEPVIYAELPRTQHAFDQFLSIRTLYAVRAIARFADWTYDRFSAARREKQQGQALRSPTSAQ